MYICHFITTAINDYGKLTPSLLVFERGDTRACSDISTVGDLIYEEDETFSAILSSTQESVVVAVSTSTVYIMDDDSKCTCTIRCTSFCSLLSYKVLWLAGNKQTMLPLKAVS